MGSSCCNSAGHSAATTEVLAKANIKTTSGRVIFMVSSPITDSTRYSPGVLATMPVSVEACPVNHSLAKLQYDAASRFAPNEAV